MRLFLRGLLIVLALAGLSWSVSILRTELQIAPIRDVAERIIVRQTFTMEALAPVLKHLDETQPKCVNGTEYAAVIRLYAAATAHTSQMPDAQQLLTKALEEAVSALWCSPHQGFLWYAVFWLEKALGSPPTKYIPALDLSYDVAPNEGWIARFRNPDALELYSDLDASLQSKIRDEYRYLLRDRINVAVTVLGEAPAPVRNIILKILQDLPLETRENFAKHVDSANLVVDIPGVDYKRVKR